MEHKQSSTNNIEGLNIRKKNKVNVFKESWLYIDEFKEWLAPHSDGSKAFCTVCNTILSCVKSELKRHANRKRHILKIEKQKQSTIDIYNDASFTLVTEDTSSTDKVKEVEIKLRDMLRDADPDAYSHLIYVLKDIFEDSPIINELSLLEEKRMLVVNNEKIDKRESEKIEDSKQLKFSVIIDDSITVKNDKILCILIKYVHPESKKPITQLLELIKLKMSNYSANNIYLAFKNCLESKGFSLKNIVGVACDNASVLMGTHDSFVSELKKEVPAIILLKYTNYSSSLVANLACSKLPESCNYILHAIATYVQNSTNRLAILCRYQELFDTESYKILKLPGTKCPISKKCVISLLDDWNILKQYFYLEVLESKAKSAQDIYDTLNDDHFKAYMLFLKYSLNFLNHFNKILYSNKVSIHKLFESSEQLIKQIGQNFLLPSSLQNISLSTIHSQNFLHLHEIYVGSECETFLKEQTSGFVEEIKSKCLDFYITATEEMIKRLPVNDTVFRDLKFLDFELALTYEGRDILRDLTNIAAYFDISDITTLAFEWRILPTIFDDAEKNSLATLNIDDLWKKILEIKTFDDQLRFPNLEKLVHAIFSLPHSSVESFTILSVVLELTDKKGHEITIENLNALCKLQSSF